MTDAGSNKVIIKSELGVDSGFVETPEGKFLVKVLALGKKRAVQVSFQLKGQRKPAHTAQTEAFLKFDEAVDALEELSFPIDLYEDVYQHIQSGLRSARRAAAPKGDVVSLSAIGRKIANEQTALEAGAGNNDSMGPRGH